MSKLRRLITLMLFRRKWRRKNRNNLTNIGNICDDDLIEVGKGTYGVINVQMFSRQFKLNIGAFCSIAPTVEFVVSADHNTKNVSTYPYKTHIVKLGLNIDDSQSKGDIVVKDDVWIGYNAIIMSGVTIGQGAVVAAGAVVTKDVPPYAIVGGVPAKVISYRFQQDIINFLLTLDYSSLTDELIKEHINDLYTNIDSLQFNDITLLYDWFPKLD